MDLDYVEIAGTGSSMVILVAGGAAVVIKEPKDAQMDARTCNTNCWLCS